MLHIFRGVIFRGNCKYPCCYCLYENYHKERHLMTQYPIRNTYTIGEFNVEKEPLVCSEWIVLPILHIKQFVKYVDKKSDAFYIIIEMFPK